MDLAVGLGGTITGEHGVGRLKRPWLAGYLGPGGDGTQPAHQEGARPGQHPQPGRRDLGSDDQHALPRAGRACWSRASSSAPDRGGCSTREAASAQASRRCPGSTDSRGHSARARWSWGCRVRGGVGHPGQSEGGPAEHCGHGDEAGEVAGDAGHFFNPSVRVDFRLSAGVFRRSRSACRESRRTSVG